MLITRRQCIHIIHKVYEKWYASSLSNPLNVGKDLNHSDFIWDLPVEITRGDSKLSKSGAKTDLTVISCCVPRSSVIEPKVESF